jgi:hypothetical protein
VRSAENKAEYIREKKIERFLSENFNKKTSTGDMAYSHVECSNPFEDSDAVKQFYLRQSIFIVTKFAIEKALNTGTTKEIADVYRGHADLTPQNRTAVLTFVQQLRDDISAKVREHCLGTTQSANFVESTLQEALAGVNSFE